MTVTKLTENLKSIIDEYDRAFAEQLAALPKEAKTERKALLIQRGMCNVAKQACLRAFAPAPAPAKKLAMHRSMLDRLPVSEKDMRRLSSLDGDDRDAATVYLSTLYSAKTNFITPYKNELAAAEECGNDGMIFELRIKLKTFEAILNDIRQWWTEHGCAEFEV